MASVRFIVASGLILATTCLRADEPKPQAQSEYRRPELVAIAWQQSKKPELDSAPIVPWRPDGSLIEGDELDWLRKDIGTFNTHWWDNNSELRPLVFVFRIDERAKSQQTLMGSLLVDGRSYPSGSGIRSTPNFLAKTAIAPSRSELASWRHEVDIEIRVPVGEAEIAKSFDRLPEGNVEIEKGVRWYVDATRGIRFQDGKREMGLPAAVLEIDRKIADPLSVISAVVWTKDGRGLSEDYATVDSAKVEIRASRPLASSNPIVRGEFHRHRYRLERFEKVPVRLDLKPQDPKPVAPAIPNFKAI